MKPEIDSKVANEIRRSKELPLIGVIGAAHPGEPYCSSIGIDVGYKLREYTDRMGGTIFTGGAEGVGADAYAGVMRFCIEKIAKKGPDSGSQMPEDRFFVLVPEYSYLRSIDDDEEARRPMFIRYGPPAEYVALASLTERGSLDIVTAGRNMDERREYVARVADTLITMNGGLGTLEEAVFGIMLSKPVISIDSGGASGILKEMKDARSGKLNKILEYNKIFLTGTEVRMLDPGLIYVASGADEMIEHLCSILR